MKSGWQKYLLYASIVIVGGFVIFETVRLRNTGFEGKSLWDWMELLIIPAVLAGGAYYLNRSERAVEHQIAEDRAKLEREIAIDRQQETALQAYLDRMTELLLKEKLLTTESKEVRDVARVRTLTILRSSDPIRKRFVLLFLYEAGLLNKENTIVDLRTADLQGANLQNANLEAVNLEGVNLKAAKMAGIILRRANLQSSNLQGADMAAALLMGADLHLALLSYSNLHGANLNDANLHIATLKEANLSQADMVGANLNSAMLKESNLSHADLNDAALIGAFLESASLYGAIVSANQLATANSLKGATMPDGTIHE